MRYVLLGCPVIFCRPQRGEFTPALDLLTVSEIRVESASKRRWSGGGSFLVRKIEKAPSNGLPGQVHKSRILAQCLEVRISLQE